MTSTSTRSDHRTDDSGGATSAAPLGLILNAGLSAGVGALLAGVPAVVGGWLGVDIDVPLRLLGIALLGHGVVLAFAARDRQVRRWTLCNLAVIAPYPLLMIAVVVAGLVETGLGRSLVLVDGAVVGAVAVLQWRGLQPRPATRKPRQL